MAILASIDVGNIDAARYFVLLAYLCGLDALWIGMMVRLGVYVPTGRIGRTGVAVLGVWYQCAVALFMSLFVPGNGVHFVFAIAAVVVYGAFNSSAIVLFDAWTNERVGPWAPFLDMTWGILLWQGAAAVVNHV